MAQHLGRAGGRPDLTCRLSAKVSHSSKLTNMSTETIVPDVAFSREQKEYLQGYFAGLACSGMIPFVGHLPDGRITNLPAPGLANGSAEAEATVYGTPVSDLCEQELWKLEQHGLDVWDKLLAHADEDNFLIRRKRFGFVIMGCFMSHRRRTRLCFAAGSRRVK
jgi:hypothetical protein